VKVVGLRRSRRAARSPRPQGPGVMTCPPAPTSRWIGRHGSRWQRTPAMVQSCRIPPRP